MTLPQCFMLLSLPITGMGYAALGALRLLLCERLELDEAKVGGLVSSWLACCWLWSSPTSST